MSNDVEISIEEQEWISLLKEARKERLDQIKRQLNEKKEEISHRKESLAKETDRLEKEFQDEENKLKEFYSLTERYLSLKGKEISSSSITSEEVVELDKTAEKFLTFLDQNEEFSKFHDKKLEEKLQKKGIHPLELGIITSPSDKKRYFTPQIAARTVQFILRNMLGFTDLKINACRFEYRSKIKEVREEYDSLRPLYKEHRGKLLKEAAVKLTEELGGICNELDETKKDPIKIAIWKALIEYERTGIIPPVILSPFHQESVNSKLEDMVNSRIITDLDALKISISFTTHYEKPVEPIEEQPAELLTEDKPVNGEIRYSILASLVGDENSARRIFEINPSLSGSNWQKFESYLVRLKDVIRSLREADRYEEISPIKNPERFSSLEALMLLENDIASRTEVRSELQEVNERLQLSGYDPEMVHALILSFKPLTARKFIGKSYLPPYAIKSNIRSLIPENKIRLVDDCLLDLVKNGVIIRHAKSGEGAYSLNPHLNEISIPVLREALALYL